MFQQIQLLNLGIKWEAVSLKQMSFHKHISITQNRIRYAIYMYIYEWSFWPDKWNWTVWNVHKILSREEPQAGAKTNASSNFTTVFTHFWLMQYYWLWYMQTDNTENYREMCYLLFLQVFSCLAKFGCFEEKTLVTQCGVYYLRPEVPRKGSNALWRLGYTRSDMIPTRRSCLLVRSIWKLNREIDKKEAGPWLCFIQAC